MTKHILADKTWAYTLTEENGVYTFCCVCGSVGIYEKNVVLTEKQIAEYHMRGEEFLQELEQSLLDNVK